MRLNDELVATIATAAIGAYPEEAVALLGQTGGEITTFYSVANAAADPSTSYLVDPGEQLEAEAEMHRRGETLAAVVHSHPRGPATPSIEDRLIARHRPDVVQIIAAVDRDELRAWTLVDKTWEEVELEPDPSTFPHPPTGLSPA
jgi:proteasome lid subunit RPN8/RPN11